MLTGMKHFEDGSYETLTLKTGISGTIKAAKQNGLVHIMFQNVAGYSTDTWAAVCDLDPKYQPKVNGTYGNFAVPASLGGGQYEFYSSNVYVGTDIEIKSHHAGNTTGSLIYFAKEP